MQIQTNITLLSPTEKVTIAMHCNLKPPNDAPLVLCFNYEAYNAPKYIGAQFYGGREVRNLVSIFDRSHLYVALVSKRSNLLKLYSNFDSADNWHTSCTNLMKFGPFNFKNRRHIGAWPREKNGQNKCYWNCLGFPEFLAITCCVFACFANFRSAIGT